MTRINIIDQLSSPEALNFVKKRLLDISKLPSSGIVGGQAVASAVFEYLNLDKTISPIYNDIDVFTTLNSSYYHSEKDNKENSFIQSINKMVGRKDSITSTFSVRGVEVTPYGEIFNYSARSEKVLTSFENGLLNRTILLTDRRDNGNYVSNVLKIISNFDINSTQIGFDIISGERLVFTSAFVDFCYRRELSITKFNTPMQSLIRLHKKASELGVESDIKTQAFLCSAQVQFIKSQNILKDRISHLYELNEHVLASKYERYHTLSLPLMFGKKHKKSFEEYNLSEVSSLSVAPGVSDTAGSYSIEIPTSEDFMDSFCSLEASALHSRCDLDIATAAFSGDYDKIIEKEMPYSSSFYYGGILNDIVADFLPVQKISRNKKNLSTIANMSDDFRKTMPFVLRKTSLIETFNDIDSSKLMKTSLCYEDMKSLPYGKNVFSIVMNLNLSYDERNKLLSILLTTISLNEDTKDRDYILSYIYNEYASNKILEEIAKLSIDKEEAIKIILKYAKAFFNKNIKSKILDKNSLFQITCLSELYDFCPDIESYLHRVFNSVYDKNSVFILNNEQDTVFSFHVEPRGDTFIDTRKVVPNHLTGIYSKKGVSLKKNEISIYIDNLFEINRYFKVLPLSDNMQTLNMFSLSEIEKLKYLKKDTYRLPYRVILYWKSFSFLKLWKSYGLPTVSVSIKIHRNKFSKTHTPSVYDDEEIPF